MSKINQRVEEYLKRISDPTGTVRRYAERLRGTPPWSEAIQKAREVIK